MTIPVNVLKVALLIFLGFDQMFCSRDYVSGNEVLFLIYLKQNRFCKQSQCFYCDLSTVYCLLSTDHQNGFPL